MASLIPVCANQERPSFVIIAFRRLVGILRTYNTALFSKAYLMTSVHMTDNNHTVSCHYLMTNQERI